MPTYLREVPPPFESSRPRFEHLPAKGGSLARTRQLYPAYLPLLVLRS